MSNCLVTFWSCFFFWQLPNIVIISKKGNFDGLPKHFLMLFQSHFFFWQLLKLVVLWLDGYSEKAYIYMYIYLIFAKFRIFSKKGKFHGSHRYFWCFFNVCLTMTKIKNSSKNRNLMAYVNPFYAVPKISNTWVPASGHGTGKLIQPNLTLNQPELTLPITKT